MQRPVAVASRKNAAIVTHGRNTTIGNDNDDGNHNHRAQLDDDDDDDKQHVSNNLTKSRKYYGGACRKMLLVLVLIMTMTFAMMMTTTTILTSQSQSHTDVVVGGGGGIDGGKNNLHKDQAVGVAELIQRRQRHGSENSSVGDDLDNHHRDDNDSRMTTSPTTNATLHIVFSTDCGSFQHWQSYLFFHSAYTIHQPGYITRIASGCTTTEQHDAQLWHDAHVRSRMSDRYRIHFTPQFSTVKDELTGEYIKDYKFFNKPFGLKHYMEYNELMGFEVAHDDDATSSVAGSKMRSSSSSRRRTMKHPDDVIILADPDFVLLRPLTDDFSNEREMLIGNRRKSIFDAKTTHIVSRGNPYAQTYGLGTQWRRFDIDAIAGPDSPAKSVDQMDGGMYYPAGPPYIVVASDMYAISEAWSEFAPKVYKQYPHLLAEMYAYCIAAAHLRLPHMLVDSLMISAIGVGGEGWKFIRDIPATDICNVAASPSKNNNPADHSAAHPPPAAVQPPPLLPSVIHYCQRYGVDKYFWGKRKMDHDIFTCEHPLLVEPPSDLGSGKYTSISHKGTTVDSKLSAFMVCALTKATNDAMVYFKSGHCDGGGNRKKEYAMMA